ncbi:MAG TPA: flagellar motor switch protein FliN [Candidatus Marinimicrobia bacterium]|jgi:flagellar motor switch protein FliN|nr:flagellar motor switch protein FliN [Candidatus Neomarinimicrobiota bacterium]
MSNIDKNKLDTWLEGNHDSLINNIKESFNQKKVEFESTTADDQNLLDQVNTEEFPCVGIQFSSSDIQHLITVDLNSGLNLYSLMSGEKIKDTLDEEQWKKFQEGIELFLLNISNSVEDETMKFTVQNLTVTYCGSADETSLSLPLDGGLSASYKFKLGKDTISVNQYLWAKNNSDEDFVDVSRAEFDSFSSENGENGNPRNIDMLLDVELEVLVELGRKSMKIKDVLKLGKGSLIELNKTAGEPLTIYVNNRKLAEGEVVVVDDNFGIRITKLASPKERIKSLG